MATATQLRATAQRALRRIPYAYTLTWSDGATCRFNLQGPGETSSQDAQRFLAFAGYLQGDFIVYPHPDDQRPGRGETVEFDGGELTLISWTATPYYTGVPLGVARWTR